MIVKWAKDMNNYFIDEKSLVSIKYMERHSTLLVIRKCNYLDLNQITLYITFIGKIEKSDTSVGEDVNLQGLLFITGGSVNLFNHFRKQFTISS